MENKSNIKSNDGTELIIRSSIVSDPKVVLFIVHGLGEHAGRYKHVADFFNKNSFSVYGMDLRGHGLSSGKRGHTPSYHQLMEDIEQCLMHIRSESPDTPVYIYGHSLGGNLVTNFILRKSISELQGAIISAPWLKVAFEAPKFKVALGKFMSKIYPALTQASELNTAHLSRNPQVEQDYKSDPLVHDQISAGLFIAGHNAAKWALENAAKLKLKTLMMHGTEDQLTSPKGTKLFADRSDKVTLKLWNGQFHEIHNEPEKEEVLNFVLNWINS